MNELLLLLQGLTCIAAIPVAIVALIALFRTFRIDKLERRVGQLQAELARRALAERDDTAEPVPDEAVVAEVAAAAASQLPIETAAIQPGVHVRATEPSNRMAGGGAVLESLIGRRVLGWVAAVLLMFGTAFFLKYAYDNGWIGPLGQVSLGLMFGLSLIVTGRRYDRSGWRVFAQMLTGAGIVVLYLATYSAFGFYRLVPQHVASIFLAVIVVESALLAFRYDAPSLGLVAVLGGLITPLLIQSERDEYQAFFIYLALLNTGVLILLALRSWIAIGTVALIGTHSLYSLWHVQNYHPEKFSWAIGFQAAIWALYVAQAVVVHVFRKRQASIEDLVRMFLVAGYWFGSAYVLLKPEYDMWLGTLAVGMAAIYAALAWLVLVRAAGNTRLLVMLLAISMGHIAIALPIEADARFVALGWAVQAAALWWFGLRVRAWPLRAIAAVLAALAVCRVVTWDSPLLVREPFVPIFNGYALPSLLVAAPVIGSVLVARRYLDRLSMRERPLLEVAAVIGIVLVWWTLSVDTYGWFVSQGTRPEADITRWRWAGHLALSVLWAVFASVLLALGFRIRRAHLRWLALALYAITVVKVFLYDMGQLAEFYRILAFFILAVLLGAAAWAYQRLQPPAARATGERQ